MRGPPTHTVKKYAASPNALAKCAAGGRKVDWLVAALTSWDRKILTQIEYKLGRIWERQTQALDTNAVEPTLEPNNVQVSLIL